MFHKLLTLLALAVFLLTLARAPWVVRVRPDWSYTIAAPLWSLPPLVETGGAASVQVHTLLLRWAAIGIIYTGLRYVLRRRPLSS